jgi:NAD(P)-dependent dehydrogenase (short-subunit alcohol dehydrogenase family)
MSTGKPLAVVTGAATDGIGTAISRRLSRDGFSIVGSYEADDSDAAEALAEELPDVRMVAVDHADRNTLDELVATVGQLDVRALVNAQFYFEIEDPDNFNFSIWDRSLAVNLTAPNYLYHALRSRFASGGSVVTVTSTEGFVGSFGASAYAATKAALHNLTMTLANNSGKLGVRVNAVAAGWIGGVMDTDEVFNMSRAITPLGRLGSPEEVAATVAYLISDEASFINGIVLIADGGYSGVDTISKYEFESSRAESMG